MAEDKKLNVNLDKFKLLPAGEERDPDAMYIDDKGGVSWLSKWRSKKAKKKKTAE